MGFCLWGCWGLGDFQGIEERFVRPGVCGGGVGSEAQGMKAEGGVEGGKVAAGDRHEASRTGGGGGQQEAGTRP